jgi:dienelactone hydrolase
MSWRGVNRLEWNQNRNHRAFDISFYRSRLANQISEGASQNRQACRLTSGNHRFSLAQYLPAAPTPFEVPMRIARFLSALLLFAAVSPTWSAENDPTRVLPPGKVLTDSRTEKLRTLDDYAPFHPPASLDAWKKRREELREQVLVANGLWPMPKRVPLNAVVHGKMDMGRYTVEKVSFVSLPGHYVTGTLFRPKNASGKSPGILSPHGHWNDGRFYDAFLMNRRGSEEIFGQLKNGAEFSVEGARYPLQARCAQLASLGCVVFHYDMLGHADSKAIPHREGFLDAEAQLRLQSTMGLQTFNSIRALDFITSLPDVDASRIGVTGASGGGTQTFILCAVDDRPAAAFPAVMVSTGMQGGCVCENCSLLRVGTGNVELAALFAPKPLAMSGANDWTKELATKGLPELKKLYALYGAEDKVAGTVYAQFPHNYNGASGLLMYEWFNKHFKLGHPTPIHEVPFIGLSSRELTVYDAEHPRPKDELDVKALRTSMATASDKQWATYVPKDELTLKLLKANGRAALKAITGWNGPVTTMSAYYSGGEEFTNELQSKDGVKLIGAVIKNSTRRTPAVTLVKPAKAVNSKVVIVWVDARGKSSLFEEGKLIAAADKALDAGATIVAIDLIGTGEWQSGTKLAVDKRFAGFTYGYNWALLSQRVQDILSAVTNSSRPGVKVYLAGFGAAGPSVLLAHSLCGESVSRCAADANHFNFSNITKTDDPMMLPGALKYGGLDCLASLNAPTPLLIHNAEGAGLGKWLNAAYSAAGHPENLTLKTEKMEPMQMIGWLLK